MLLCLKMATQSGVDLLMFVFCLFCDDCFGGVVGFGIWEDLRFFRYSVMGMEFCVAGLVNKG